MIYLLLLTRTSEVTWFICYWLPEQPRSYDLFVIVAQSLVFCVVTLYYFSSCVIWPLYFCLTFILRRGRRDRDRMIVGFTTTYAISAYYHWCCEFESRSGRCEQHYVIKVCQWLATGRWFSLGTPVSSTNKTDRHDITEILLIVALNTITLTLVITFSEIFAHKTSDYATFF